MPLSLSALLSGKAVSLTSFTKNGTFAVWKQAVLRLMKKMLPLNIKRDLYLSFIVGEHVDAGRAVCGGK